MAELMTEIIIAFVRTFDAVRAESLLYDDGISPMVMPLPAAVRAGCGLCLRVKPEEVERAKACLSDMEQHWYVRRVKPGGTEYEPLL